MDHTGHLVEELLSQVQMNAIMVMKMVITLVSSFECDGGIVKSCKPLVTPSYCISLFEESLMGALVKEEVDKGVTGVQVSV